MKEDQFDNILRSKLQDFEAPTAPDSWNSIAEKLPVVMPARTITPWYYAAAAVAALLIASGSLALFTNSNPIEPTIKELAQQTENKNKGFGETPTPTHTDPAEKEEWLAVAKQPKIKASPTLLANRQVSNDAPIIVAEQQAVSSANHSTSEAQPTVAVQSAQATQAVRPTNTQRSNVKQVPATVSPKKASKWSFGMSGGNVGTGTSSSMNTYALRNSYKVDDRLMLMNNVASSTQNSSPKTDIHHHRPISFGLGVNRALNKRFSLQSGLVYSFMKSDWETNGTYHVETTQKLHFIGIPLSLAYNIAEWNKFIAYASTGVMTEFNVAGKMNSSLYSQNKEINTVKEDTRMKEFFWSVNARVGVSYPLIRFINVFAEAGVDYYFENGSHIETAHSEKPFSASFQVGFRFGI
jgi:predicted ribosomally synthesized peptide with SipW-like signal peptide